MLDVNNTSGFFPLQRNGVVAIFTLATPEIQEQALAYSRDGGYTFEMYEGNPVIPSASNEFRDPKVIWYEDHWVMVVAFSQDFTVGVYTSLDLKDWTQASNFSHHGLLGLQYECPNLVQMPVQSPLDGSATNQTAWLLLLSINPGGPLGGSATQFFPGAFDGYTFTAVDSAARLTDFSTDNYAGQFFYNPPTSSAAVSIAWASNWDYAARVPTGPAEGWRSCMTLPRVNALRNVPSLGWTLVSTPYSLSTVLGPEIPANNSTNTDTDTLANKTLLNNGSIVVDYSHVPSNALYFSARMRGIPPQNATGTLNVTFSSPVSGEFLTAGFFVGNAQPRFFVSRAGVRGFGGDDVFWTTKFSAGSVVLPGDSASGDGENDGSGEVSGAWSVNGVVDRSILEIFINDGSQSGTTLFYADEPLTIVSIAVAGLAGSSSSSSTEATTTEIKILAVKSAWSSMQDPSSGLVWGNITVNRAADAAAACCWRGDEYQYEYAEEE